MVVPSAGGAQARGARTRFLGFGQRRRRCRGLFRVLVRLHYGAGIAGQEEFGYQSRPAGLMGGPDAAAAVAVEVFVEQDVIAEMRVALHARVVRIHRAGAALVREEDSGEAAGELVGDFIETDEAARAARALDAELIPV